VDSKPLTIEQQKDYVRRYIEGCEAASQLQEEEARTSTPEQKWNAIETVQDPQITVKTKRRLMMRTRTAW